MHNSIIYTSKQIVGKKIRTLREKKKLTLQQLADMLDTDRQHISKIEKGKKNITLDYLDKIIEKLESKHEKFFNSKNDYNIKS